MASLVLPMAARLEGARVEAHPWRSLYHHDPTLTILADDHGTLTLTANNRTRYLLGHCSRVLAATLLPTFEVEERLTSAVVSLDSRGSLAVWAVEDGRCLLYHDGGDTGGERVGSVVFVAGCGLVVVADRRGAVLFYDSATLDLHYLVTLDVDICIVSIHGYQAGGRRYIVCHTTGSCHTAGSCHTTGSCSTAGGGVRLLEIVNGGKKAVVVEECDFVDLKRANVASVESSRDSRGLRITYTTTEPEMVGMYNPETSQSQPAEHQMSDIQPTFTATSAGSLQDSFVIGGTHGDYIIGHLDTLFCPLGPFTVHRTGLDSDIVCVLMFAGKIWLGDADGAVSITAVTAVTAGITSPPPDIKCMRVSSGPLVNLLQCGGHVLAVGADGIIGVLCAQTDTLLYTFTFPAAVAISSVSHDNTVIVSSDGKQFHVHIPSGVVRDVKEPQDKQQSPKTEVKGDLCTLLSLGPHGMVKVLQSRLPGILILVDMRSVVTHLAQCRFADNLQWLIGERRFGMVGASGLMSVTCDDPITTSPSPAESAIGLLSFVGMGGTTLVIPPGLLARPYPSVSIVAKFWCDHVRGLERASRHIFGIIAGHLHGDHHLADAIVGHWQPHLRVPCDVDAVIGVMAAASTNTTNTTTNTTNTNTTNTNITTANNITNTNKTRKPMNRAAVIIAIVMILLPEHRPPLAVQKAVMASLLQEMRDDRKHLFRIAAISLLGDLAATVEPFIVVYEDLVRPWLVELAPHAVTTSADPWTLALLGSIRGALRGCLCQLPYLFDDICANLQQLDGGTLLSLFHDVISHLPNGSIPRKAHTMLHGKEAVVAETICKLLDPSNAKQRTRLLPAAAPLLHLICTVFPTVAFHADKQLLAGASGGFVAVWDLRTGLRVLHQRLVPGGLDAIAFSVTGDQVVGVSIEQRILTRCKVAAPLGVMAMVFGSPGADVKMVWCDFDDAKRVDIEAAEEGRCVLILDQQRRVTVAF